MSAQWDRLVASDGFQRLPPGERARVRNNYFEKVLAPKIPPDKLEVAAKRWESYRPEDTRNPKAVEMMGNAGYAEAPTRSRLPVPLRADLLDDVQPGEIQNDAQGRQAVIKNGQAFPMDAGFDASTAAPQTIARAQPEAAAPDASADAQRGAFGRATPDKERPLSGNMGADMAMSGATRAAMLPADLAVGTADLAARGARAGFRAYDALGIPGAGWVAEQITPIKDQQALQDTYMRGRRSIQDAVSRNLSLQTQEQQQAVAEAMEAASDGSGSILDMVNQAWSGASAMTSNPRALAVVLAETVPDLFVAGGFSRAAATPMYKATYDLHVRAGFNPRAAALIAAKRTAAKATGVAAGSEALIAANMSADQAAAAIDDVSDEELAAVSPRFASLLPGVGSQEARRQMKADAMDTAAGITAGITAAAGRLTGASSQIGKIATRGVVPQATARSIPGAAARGVAAQGAEEFIQEGGDAFAQNRAAIDSGADPDRDSMRGVLAGAGAGAVAGAALGGPIGIAADVGRSEPQAAAEEAPRRQTLREYMAQRKASRTQGLAADLSASTQPDATEVKIDGVTLTREMDEDGQPYWAAPGVDRAFSAPEEFAEFRAEQKAAADDAAVTAEIKTLLEKEPPDVEISPAEVAAASDGREGDQALGSARTAPVDSGRVDGERSADAGMPASGLPAPAPVGTAQPEPAAALKPKKPKAPDTPEAIEANERRNLLKMLRGTGIDLGERADITREQGRSAARMAPGLFRNGGRTIDDVATDLYNAGYITETDFNDVDGGVQAARDLIYNAITKSEPVLSIEARDRWVALKADEEIDARAAADEVGADPFDFAEMQSESLSADSKPDVIDYALVEQANEADEAAVEMAARQFENNDAGFMRAVQEIIDGRAAAEGSADPITERGAQGQGSAPGGARGAAGSATGEPAAQAEVTQQAPDPGAFSLEPQTEQGLQAQAQRQQRAEADATATRQQAERRAESERDAGDFVLTGSDRPADVGTARGQADIFANATNRTPDPALDPARIAAMAEGAKRREDQEREGRAKQNAAAGLARRDAVEDRQATPQTFEGVEVLRIGNEPFVAVPASRRQNSAKFEIIDIRDRSEPATTLKRSEVQSWLFRAGEEAAATRADEGGKPESVKPKSIASLTGANADGDMVAFADTSESLSIPRAEMPQIKAQHRGAMVNFLNARGISHRQDEEVDPQTLKPTQAEFSPSKVEKAKAFSDSDRSILVSSDGHVVDGHHQWLAKLDEGSPIKVIRLDAPIRELLPVVREFPSAEAAPSPEKVKSQSKKLDDFGEKLGGARKDASPSLSRELTDADIVAQPLSKIWPKSEIDAVEDKFVAALLTAARDQIPTKPRKGYKLTRWVQTVQQMRGMARSAQTAGREKVVALIKETPGLDNWYAKVRLLEALDRNQWSRIGGVVEAPDAYAYVDGERVNQPAVLVGIDGRKSWFQGFGDVDQALPRIREKLSGTDVAKPKMQFEIRVRRVGGKVFINKKGDAERRPLREFDDVKAARAFINDNYDDLVAEWEGVKDRQNVRKTDVRRSENRPRTGADRRGGRDADDAMFTDAFGFRGVEFGNWLGQGAGMKERQGMLNEVYDALMDLSDIVGVPPRAMSLGGTLGLGLGSRGQGGRAAAHFEPDTLVINLTKTKGAGSLAHEWFHALDNYFARKRGERKVDDMTFITQRPEPLMVRKDRSRFFPPMTRGQLAAKRRALGDQTDNFNEDKWERDPSAPLGVRPEVEERFAGLVEALNESPMAARARLMDSDRKPYWSQVIERGARSFENYVISKMLEKGYQNDFLANVVTLEDFARDKGRYPYLTPEEVAPVASAFDALFETIQTRDEGGNVALFSRDGQSDPQTEAPAFKRWFDDSKVVDADGQPLVVYHGTTAKIDRFTTGSRGRNFMPRFADGFYFTSNPEAAAHYAGDRDGANIIPAYLSIQNPLNVSGASEYRQVLFSARNEGSRYEQERRAAMRDSDLLQEIGYDGLIYRFNGDEEIVAFRPEQIKSATGNRGTFDPADPDITRLQAGSARASNRNPAPEWETAQVEKLAGILSKQADATIPLRAAEAPTAMRGMSDAIESLLGRKVVFFESDNPLAPAGVYVSGGVLFVNADAKQPLRYVAGHEFTHSIERADPELHATLKARILEMAKDGVLPAYQARLGGVYERDGLPPLSRMKVENEFVADVMGSIMSDPKVMFDLKQRMEPTAFRRLVNRIRFWIERMLSKLRGDDMRQSDFAKRMVKDLEGAKSLVADVLAATAEGQLVSDMGDAAPAFSRDDASNFSRYRALGQQEADAGQSLEDAQDIVGMRSSIAISRRDDMPAHVPMRFDPANGVIEVNSNLPLQRADAAYFMVEELYHAIDVMKNGRSISAGSPMFQPDGEIWGEALAAMSGDPVIDDFLNYPMRPERPLPQARQSAELFARLGVLYHGNPEAFRRAFPKAHEVYDAIHSGVTRSFQELREPLRAGSERRAALRSGGGADGRPQGRDGAGSGNWQSDPELGSVRRALAGALKASRLGRSVPPPLETRTGLTESEARYLANYKPAERVRARIASALEAGSARAVQGDRLPADDVTQTPPDGGVSRSGPDVSFIRGGQTDPDSYAAENRRLREQDRSAYEKAKTAFRRVITPSGLLPNVVFDMNRHRQRLIAGEDYDTSMRVGALEAAVKRDYGVDFDSLPETQMRQMNEALVGRFPLDSLRPHVKRELLAMRQSVDGYSAAFIAQLHQSPDNEALIEKISGNVGSYLHRSYKAFDDPDWFKRVPDAVLNRARDYLRQQYVSDGVTPSEAARKAEVTLNKILKTGTAYDSMEKFVTESKLGAKDLSVLVQRKVIAPQIRALLGEYVDPRVNYSKSAAKMSRLILNGEFLAKVREASLGVFLFEGDDRPADATVQLAGEASEVYAPLNGLWATPEIAQAFKDAMGGERLTGLWKTIVRVNGTIKYGKTVLSPTTAMRNWQSALFFSLANGHFDARKLADGMKLARARYRRGRMSGEGGTDGRDRATNVADNAYIKRLIRLGVVGDGAQANEVMRLIDDSKLEALLEGFAERGAVFEKSYKVMRAVNDFAQTFYSFGDDFWKIVGFEQEKAGWIEAGLSDADAEAKAAERIVATYPTYSMQGMLVKGLARLPVIASFPTFTAEIIRTQANMVRLTVEDIRSGNPAIRKMGWKRAMGMVIANGFAGSMAMLTASLFGVDDEEEEALRDLAPPWQTNSTFMYTGRDEDGRLRYFDLTFLDPYGYFKRPLTAMLRDQPWEDAAASAAGDLLSPFVSQDIAFGVFVEVLSNRKQSGAPLWMETDGPAEKAGKVVSHVAQKLQPGITANIQRTLTAIEGDVTPSGRKLSVEDEAMAWLGWRASTLDPKTSLYYRAFEFSDQVSEARQTVTRVLRDMNDVSQDEIEDAVSDGIQRNERAFREMQRIVIAARNAGMDQRQIVDALSGGRLSKKYIAALLRDEAAPLTLSLQAQRAAQQAAKARGGGEMVGEINRRYNEARKVASKLQRASEAGR